MLLQEPMPTPYFAITEKNKVVRKNEIQVLFYRTQFIFTHCIVAPENLYKYFA